MTGMLEAAQKYAASGFPLFPCHSIRNGRCTCGRACSSPGKHPRSENGFYDATTSAERITVFWKRVCDANIGIPTGPESGILVLDLDNKHGGENTLGQLEKKHGYLPKGPEVVTGAGRHFYFKYPKGIDVPSRSGIAPGIDIRAKGGYVVAPPSSHVSGKRYAWAVELNGTTPQDLPEPPAWLIDLATQQLKKHSGDPCVTGKVSEGQRNQHLASLAGSMRRRGMTEQAMLAALKVENIGRCSPPLPDSEVETIAHSVARYDPEPDSKPIPQTPPKSAETLFRTAADIHAMQIAGTKWLAHGFVAFGAVTEIIGKVKEGKTTLVLDLVRACVTGGRFLDRDIARTAVVYLTEQVPASFRSQLRRASLGGAENMHVLFYHEVRQVTFAAVIEIAADYARKAGAGLLVLDTFGRFAGFDGDGENSAADGQAKMQELNTAAAAGLAVISLRHGRKSGGDVNDAGRGSSAISGAADICCGAPRATTRQCANWFQ